MLSKTMALVGIGVATFGVFMGCVNDQANKSGVLLAFAIIGGASVIALAISERNRT